jgi:hypothetical protein
LVLELLRNATIQWWKRSWGWGRSKTIFHDGTSGWEDVEEEDETLARVDDLENSHLMEGIEEQATITVSNFPVLL